MRLDADCQKQDRKIIMMSYLEAATKHFEVVIFKTTSQLDLASLPDNKNMLLSKGKVYSATGSGKSLYKSFVVVVSPLMSLI